jgi:hypothetical protein
MPSSSGDPAYRRDMPERLGLGIKRNEGVLITELARIVERRDVALLLADICPDLVNLDAATWKLAHLLVQRGASIADLDQQAAYRIPMRAGHSLGRTYRVPSTKQLMTWTRRASGTRFIGSPPN